MNEKVGLLGSGGQSAEVESYLAAGSIQFRAIDKKYISAEDEINILTPTDEQLLTPVVASVGAPGLRRELVWKWAGDNYTKVISPNAYIGTKIEISEGAIIAPGVVMTTEIEIGRHALINVGATISHGDRLGDYVTVSPGVHIGGDVLVGDGVFIGIGATISNGIQIARGSVIGAGAVVINDILEENSVVVGLPAKPIKVNDEWLKHV